MQTLYPTFSLHPLQTLNLAKFGMHRQRGAAPTVFKPVETTQTYCQKEERFTVQNKITDASPHLRSATKNKTLYSAQILMCHKERSALQNKKSAAAIETELRFDGHRENLMNQSGKTHPKSEALIRHKPLYVMEKSPDYKTRIRTEAKTELIAAKPLNTERYIQITKQGLIKNAPIVLTRTLPVWVESLDRHHATFFKSYQRSQTSYQKEERFMVQNKMTDAGVHPRTVSKRITFSLRQTCHSSKRR
jgi:hypothetical protein